MKLRGGRRFLGLPAGPQRGASAVEMAIILPLLVLLVFGAIEFGVFLYDQQVLTNASREGARAGIIQRVPRLSDGEIDTIVNDYAAGHLITFGDGATSPSTTVTREGDLFGNDLTVTVNYMYSFFVVANLIPGFESPRQMTAQTTMKME